MTDTATRSSLILVFLLMVGMGSTVELCAQNADYYSVQNPGSGNYMRHLNVPPFLSGMEPLKWQMEAVSGTDCYWLKAPDGTALHVEHGSLEQGAIDPGWHSAHWRFVPVPGTMGNMRIQNRWTQVYLCFQNGALIGSAYPESGTDVWAFAKVPSSGDQQPQATTPPQPQAQPSNNQPATNPNEDVMNKATKLIGFVQQAAKTYNESQKTTTETPQQPEPPSEEAPAQEATETPGTGQVQPGAGRMRAVPNQNNPAPSNSTKYSYRFILQCDHPELENEGTNNTLSATLYSGGVALQTISKTGICQTGDKPTFNFNPTDSDITHVSISTNGSDAFFADKVILRKRAAGETGGFALVRAWGDDGGNGHCLSTDPQDAFGGWKGRIKSCNSKIDFRLDGSIQEY